MYPNPFNVEMDPYRGVGYVQPEYFSMPSQPHLNQHQIQAWYEYMSGSKGAGAMNPLMSGHPMGHPQMGPPPPMNFQPNAPQPSGGAHYFTHLNNTNSTPTSASSSNLDQLNLSRTIIFKNINDDISISELLDNIDLGPIEYCKIFSKPTPQHLMAQDPSVSKNLKTCYVSFINSSISIQFHINYVKNTTNFNKLKQLLGPHLKIVLNDNSNNLQQDFIKLKTLNYIVEFNATRGLLLKFDVADTITSNAPDAPAPLAAIKQFISNQCIRFGDVEDFKISLSDTPDSRNRYGGKALVHFTSIDAAIKTYESYLRRINDDKHRVIDLETQIAPNKQKESYLVHVHYDIKFTHASFHKDRCDKTATPYQKSKPKHEEALPQQDLDLSLGVLSPGDSDSFDAALNEELHREKFLMDAINPDKDPLLALPSSPTLSSSSPDHVSPSDSPQPRNAGSYISSSSPLLTPNLYRSHSHHSQLYHHGPPPPHPYMVQHSTMIPQTPRNPAIAPTPNYQLNPDPFNIGNRTIYLGNLHVNSTIEEIANNVRAGGLVESIKYHPEKRVCFITFVDPNVALKFYLNHQVLHQLIVHGHDITVGWAKNHSGPLSREISLAVTAGASRNVYIGIKLVKDAPVQEGAAKLKLPDEATLRRDFSMFGPLEQINFYHNKDCGFLNFLDIIDAIRVVESFEVEDEAALDRLYVLLEESDEGGERDNHAMASILYHKYKDYKISFAKDRCGNSPKFSFKKKSNNSYGSTYQQYLHLLHDNLQKRNRHKKPETYDEETRTQEHDSFMEDTINEEAAMVFGIISNSEKKDKEEVEVKPKSDNEDEEGEEEDDDADDDDDEEVSIIIGGEGSSPSSISGNGKVETKKKPRQNHSHRINNHQKVYHNKYNMSDSYLPTKKSMNSSNVSLNSMYHKYGVQPSPFQSSPYMMQQQLLYFPSQTRPGSRSMYAYSGAGTPTKGYPPQYNPQPLYYPPPVQQHPKHNQDVTSGSQVMAQYLARSQHDNLLYASSVMTNDAGFDEDVESFDYESLSERRGSFSSQKSRKAKR